MSTSQKLLIRDALPADLQTCQQLDSHYDTDYVWQMNVFQDVGERQIIFKQERLPRALETKHPIDEARLRIALTPDHCFIVAAHKETIGLIFGFLIMRHEPFHGLAIISDIIVDTPYRRHGIGLRLLKVARRWASERDIKQLIIETSTKNHPAIMFCQRAGLVFCGFSDQHFENQDIAVFFGQRLH